MKRGALPIINKVIACLFLGSTFLVNPSAEAALYSFTSHTFTNCTATGYIGPTQVQCRSAYTTTGSWDESDSNFTVTNGIQYWTVPASGTYSIRAIGASGGTQYGMTGLGASIKGDFQLAAGSVLKILVGQTGTPASNTSYGAGGGGGSFVTKADDTLLIAAGGGGGPGNGGGHFDASFFRTYADASITTTGKSGDTYAEAGGAGGTNGNAGGTSASSWNGYPGSGFLQNAASGGAKNWSSVMTGGNLTTYGVGGFGGGGSGGMYGGSGGGGYSGGGANSRHGPGGGGSSYNLGANKVETLTATSGHGSVLITLIAVDILDTTISVALPDAFTYRTSSNIVATVSAPGRVTFIANGKRIAGCISVPTISSSTITATCTFKPSFRGDLTISATLAPNDASAYRPSTSESLRKTSTARSGRR